MSISGLAPTTKPPIAVVIPGPYAPAGPIIAGTSGTDNDIGVGGSYTWVMDQFGLGFTTGTRLRATPTDAPTLFIEGNVTGWDGTSVTILSDLTSGFGVHSNWNIGVTGTPGKKGDRGDPGPSGPSGPPGGAPLNSPAFTGTPTTPTPATADSSTQIASTQFVKNVALVMQPLDTDLTALAALSGVGVIYYRSADGAWSPVTMGTNMTFSTGTLSASLTGTAPLASPAFTGTPTAPTPTPSTDSSTKIATTAFVYGAGFAPLAAPTFTGVPKAPTPSTGDSSTALATTAYVQNVVVNFQPLSADLTGVAGITATGVLIYRKAGGDWKPVIMGANIGFDPASGTLSASGGSGSGGGIPEAPNDASMYGRISLGWQHCTPEAPEDGQRYARQTNAWTSIDIVLNQKASLSSPAFTGTPTAPTAAASDNSTIIATTAMVQAALGNATFAPLSSPAFTGTPTAPTQATADASTRLATTQFVKNQLYAPLASPVLTGTPSAPTAVANDNSQALATTAFVKSQNYATLLSPALTGTPTAPTPSPGDNSQSIATTAFIQAVLALSSGFTTGDVKLTLKTVADAGWILMNDQTIGDATSGANYANVAAQSLYVLLWTNIIDTWCPVTGGRGASAAADWAAHKPMKLPRTLGRALATLGSGAGLTARALGQTVGEETHSPILGEMPSHGHTVSDPTHTHPVNTQGYPIPVQDTTQAYSTADIGGQFNAVRWGGALVQGGMVADSHATGIGINAQGSGSPHNVMQPTAFLNVMVKL